MVNSPAISPGTRKRLSRIRRRAIPEVCEAYENGAISARMADTLLYLPAEEQAAELERRLSAAKARERKHQLVAAVIRSYLKELGERKVNLDELSKTIRAALGNDC